MRRMWGRRVLMLIITVALLVLTIRVVGVEVLARGGQALTPVTILAALGCGLAATAAQALRFSLLLTQSGTRVTGRRTLADCYSASWLNMVLPGGLGGDLARVAAYRNTGSRRWLSSLTVVGAERLSATTVLFATATVILAPVAPRFAWIAGAVTVVTGIVSILAMRKMRVGIAVLVWAAAAVTIGAFLALYLITMEALGGPVVPALAIVGLAAMSVPLGVGGWGVREVTVGLLAASLGSTAEWAVASSAGYGLLATVSTLPGALTLAVSLWRRHRGVGQAGDWSGRSPAR